MNPQSQYPVPGASSTRYSLNFFFLSSGSGCLMDSIFAIFLLLLKTRRLMPNRLVLLLDSLPLPAETAECQAHLLPTTG